MRALSLISIGAIVLNGAKVGRNCLIGAKALLGLMAPKGTPQDVIARLNSEINEILAAPAERQSLEQQGMLVAGGSPADFAKQIAADYEARGKIIHELKLSAD